MNAELILFHYNAKMSFETLLVTFESRIWLLYFLKITKKREYLWVLHLKQHRKNLANHANIRFDYLTHIRSIRPSSAISFALTNSFSLENVNPKESSAVSTNPFCRKRDQQTWLLRFKQKIYLFIKAGLVTRTLK